MKRKLKTNKTKKTNKDIKKVEDLDVSGTLFIQDTKEVANIKANSNYIHILSDSHDIVISYKYIVIIGHDEKSNFVLIDYHEGNEEETKQIKFFPEKNSELLYESLKEFNMLNPNENFENELEGDNELFTADNLDSNL